MKINHKIVNLKTANYFQSLTIAINNLSHSVCQTSATLNTQLVMKVTRRQVETCPGFESRILFFKLLHLKSILIQCLLFQTDAKHKINSTRTIYKHSNSA